MDDRRVADYFVIAGLPANPLPLEDFSWDGASHKSSQNLNPITDIAVIFPSLGEVPPEGFTLLETTPTGLPANLNHGSIRSPSVYLCYRRGRDKPPLVDIGIYYEGGKECVLKDVEVIYKTPGDRCANVNNSVSCSFITIRRALETDPCNVLVVTEICVILPNKGENPPPTFCRIDKDLNRGFLGSVVYLCYKKSMNRVNSVAYKPGTLARYPLDDHLNFPFPDSVPLFCLPMGATIECWPKKSSKPEPVFSTFVLTVSDAVEKVYGAAISFYEQYPEDRLTVQEKTQLGLAGGTDSSDQNLNAIKSMCILSHWPFFSTFRSFLQYLHNMSLSGPHAIPIERYVSHFMQEVPFPSPQRPRILIQLSTSEQIVLIQPEDSPLPLSGASFTEFLKNLGPENCLSVLLFALTEQKIVLHSLRPDVLTSVAEAISMLIFPFRWQCPYIPLCPLGLSDVLSAPMPYIVGVDSRYFDLYCPPSDIYCVNLDTNSISHCDDKKPLSVKLLPKKPVRSLEKTLTALFKRLHLLTYGANPQESRGKLPNGLGGRVISNEELEDYFKEKKRERFIETEIQEAFLRFMACILKGFRHWLRPITGRPTIRSTDCNALFDINGFLKSRDKAYHRFYGLLMKTQMFTRFVEERSFVTDKDASLAFFDECTEKVDTADGREAPLIELDEAHQSERTVYVPLPDTMGLPTGATYSYDRLSLDSSLFHSNKHRKNLLSVSNRASPAPSSPMARRTKQEKIRSAQKLAQKHSENPEEWAMCLRSYTFCLWFIHLPAYVKETRCKRKVLKMAFDVLFPLQGRHLQPFDEVCYRVLMQLCGQYGEPVLAIKLLTIMKNNGIQPNAITYGYYNKAVLESKWPSQNSKHELWNKLRYAILVIGQFRHGVKHRPLSLHSESDAASSESGLPEEGGGAYARSGSERDACRAGDHESTGGQSDVGYSSLNLDDVQKSSSSIDSSLCVSLNGKEGGGGGGGRASAAGGSGPASTAGKNDGNNKDVVDARRTQFKEGSKKVAKSLKYDSVDFTESNEFRTRVGSIVRNSECAFTNRKLDAMRGSATVDSVAGLLISSQAMLDDAYVTEEDKEDGDGHGGPCSSEPDDQDVAARARHGSGGGQKGSVYSPSSQPSVQECDSSTELLRSGSYGSDVRILSHLSNSSANDLESAVFECDDSRLDEGTGGSGHDARDSGAPLGTYDWEPSPADRPRPGNHSPNIPIRSGGGTRSNSVTSPQLTPVTQNDPLGVFTTSSPLSSIAGTRPPLLTSAESPAAVGSSQLVMKEMNPQLFRAEPKRRTINMGHLEKGRVPRSTSFCVQSPPLAIANDVDQLAVLPDAKAFKSHTILHRSSTVPDTAKLGDGRGSYSSQGGGGEGGGAAVASPLYSHFHSLASRLQTFNTSHAQTWKTVVTKLSEIKETLSSKSFPNTPIKTNYLPKTYEVEKKLLFDEDDERCSESLSRQSSIDHLARNGRSTDDLSVDGGNVERSRAKSYGSLPSTGGDCSFDPGDRFSSGDYENASRYDSVPLVVKRVTATTALEMLITSCCRCHYCQGVLHDEEIMANWSHEESDLNTRCAFCKRKVVPVLTVVVRDYRSESSDRVELLTPAQSTESIQSVHSFSTFSTAPRHRVPAGPREVRPCFRLEDSPESTSVASDVGSPVGSPQKQAGSFLQQGTAAWTGTPGTGVASARSETDIARPDGRTPSTLGTGGGSTSNVTVQLGCGGANLLTASLPNSAASSATDVYGGDAVDDGSKDALYTPVVTLDPIIIPYLSPIVLRKELETVLDDEGDHSLTQSEFVDEHPIIFWNLLWYCKRIGVPTHLAGLCLKAKAINKDRPVPKNWTLAHSQNVLVRCTWDNSKLHEETGPPMYAAWKAVATQSSLVHALVTESSAVNRGVIQQIISGIQCDDVVSPLKIMISELRKKRPGSKGKHYSIYRDLLFLCISYIGRHNIDLVAFDREYQRAFHKLSPSERHFLQKYDYPPEQGVLLCRQCFRGLEL